MANSTPSGEVPENGSKNGQYLKNRLWMAGMSQAAAARHLGINSRTMARYCASASPVSIVVLYAIEWLTHGFVDTEADSSKLQ